MIRGIRGSSAVVVVFASCAAAACGSFSATEPSGIGPAGSSGAVITGTVLGLAPSALTAADSGGPVSNSFTVAIAGTNIVSGVDSTGKFRLSGIPSGPVQLNFKGAGFEAALTLTVTEGERIELTVRISGNSLRIEAERREQPDRTKVEGTISEVNAAARTIRVTGVLIEVPVGAVIRSSRTLTFADLQVGDRVEVEGRLEGSRVMATEVHVRGRDDDDDDEGDDDDDRRDGLAEAEGVVSGLSGTCPAISFTIRGIAVRTNNTTRFDDGTCEQVLNNIEVDVRGQRQNDGSIVATLVEIDD